MSLFEFTQNRIMKFLSKKTIIAIGCLAASVLTANAQSLTKDKFGKGLKVLAADSSFYMKASLRLQNRYDGVLLDGDYTDQMFLRRARIKFDGFAYSPKVVYKLEADIVAGEIKDAVVKWNFYKKFVLWAGQTKLPGNRERVISSQKLQFVDRSQLNSKFTLDRDKGLQLRHSFKIGKMLVREAVAVSQGEGPNQRDKKFSSTPELNGKQYTFRMEFLPFGKFTGKGDYFGSDLKREEKPKLSIAGTYDFNNNAIRTQGNLKDFLAESRDIRSYFADFMFKYKGVSIMGEYALRNTNNNGNILLADGSVGTIYTGDAINLTAGYLLKNNVEIAGRFTQVNPDAITGKTTLKEYTLGLSKYIVGHSLKVQSDFTLRQEEGKDDLFEFRLQCEVSL